jgi:hypothetical protein
MKNKKGFADGILNIIVWIAFFLLFVTGVVYLILNNIA